MNKLFKSISLALAAVLCAGALTGCKDTPDTLVVGTNAAFPPFEYTTQDGLVGEFDGIDIAIAVKIAEKAGKELEVADMQFDGLLGAVNSGKVDMVAAGMTVTEDRKKNVDFSDTYYVASQIMVVAADNTDITCAEDLKNDKKVGVVLGYTGDTIVTEDLALDESNIQRANRAHDIVQDVKNGKLDALVVDSYTGIALAEKNGLKVVEDADAFESEEYAIAVKKGNAELLEVINTALAEMKESGYIDELTKTYGAVDGE